jgi:hypothetical protein
MGHIESRNKYYHKIVKAIEEKTIKEKEKSKEEKKEEQPMLYAPTNDSYVFESDSNNINIPNYSKCKVDDLIYVKKSNEPLFKYIIIVTGIKSDGEVDFQIIDSFEPPVQVNDINEMLGGEET